MDVNQNSSMAESSDSSPRSGAVRAAPGGRIAREEGEMNDDDQDVGVLDYIIGAIAFAVILTFWWAVTGMAGL